MHFKNNSSNIKVVHQINYFYFILFNKILSDKKKKKQKCMLKICFTKINKTYRVCLPVSKIINIKRPALKI